MKLEIVSFVDSGNLSKERLVLRALEDMDIGRYVILRSKKAENGSPVSGSKNAYWLPDALVERGDLIVLYTRRGSSAKKELASGKTAHFYYWHQKATFWGDDMQNTAVLLEARDWLSKAPRK